MSIFQNHLHGGKIGNAMEAEHHTGVAKARERRNYFIGFGVILVVIGVLIGLSVGGII